MRRGLGRGRGKGYYNLVPIDAHIHYLSSKGIKLDKSLDAKHGIFYRMKHWKQTPLAIKRRKLKAIRGEENAIKSMEISLGSPQVGAFAIRSASAVLGLGFDAVGLTIPVVGLAVGGGLGLVYLEEKYLQKKLEKQVIHRNQVSLSAKSLPQQIAGGSLYIAERIPAIGGVPVGMIVKASEYVPLTSAWQLKRFSERGKIWAKGSKTWGGGDLTQCPVCGQGFYQRKGYPQYCFQCRLKGDVYQNRNERYIWKVQRDLGS